MRYQERNKVDDSTSVMIINRWYASLLFTIISLSSFIIFEHPSICATIRYPNNLTIFGCSNTCECLFPFLSSCCFVSTYIIPSITALFLCIPLYNVMFSVSAIRISVTLFFLGDGPTKMRKSEAKRWKRCLDQSNQQIIQINLIVSTLHTHTRRWEFSVISQLYWMNCFNYTASSLLLVFLQMCIMLLMNLSLC